MLERFPYDLLLSVVAGLTTLIAAILSHYVTRRRRKENQEEIRQVEVIADALQKEEAAKKVTIVERVVEKMPPGLSKEQFSLLLD
jgi:uncharacterized membrane protein (DUF106 family)